MATTWELVSGNSTAPNGSTFWTHLNNQSGEGGGANVFLTGGVDVLLEQTELESEVDMVASTYELDMQATELLVVTDEPDMSLELETQEITLESCDD